MVLRSINCFTLFDNRRVALSLDAYAFTSFYLIENGYVVPFNPAVYLIDLFILFPMFLIFHYFVTKNGINKIKALPPDDIRRDVL